MVRPDIRVNPKVEEEIHIKVETLNNYIRAFFNGEYYMSYLIEVLQSRLCLKLNLSNDKKLERRYELAFDLCKVCLSENSQVLGFLAFEIGLFFQRLDPPKVQEALKYFTFCHKVYQPICMEFTDLYTTGIKRIIKLNIKMGTFKEALGYCTEYSRFFRLKAKTDQSVREKYIHTFNKVLFNGLLICKQIKENRIGLNMCKILLYNKSFSEEHLKCWMDIEVKRGDNGQILLVKAVRVVFSAYFEFVFAELGSEFKSTFKNKCLSFYENLNYSSSEEELDRRCFELYQRSKEIGDFKRYFERLITKIGVGLTDLNKENDKLEQAFMVENADKDIENIYLIFREFIEKKFFSYVSL